MKYPGGRPFKERFNSYSFIVDCPVAIDANDIVKSNTKFIAPHTSTLLNRLLFKLGIVTGFTINSDWVASILHNNSFLFDKMNSPIPVIEPIEVFENVVTHFYDQNYLSAEEVFLLEKIAYGY